MQVPMEETINQIMERYVSLNAHALSYEALKLCTCDTHEGKVFVALDMNKSLEENGVFDESLEYGEMGMEINHLIPVMDVHYTDDLTVAWNFLVGTFQCHLNTLDTFLSSPLGRGRWWPEGQKSACTQCKAIRCTM